MFSSKLQVTISASHSLWCIRPIVVNPIYGPGGGGIYAPLPIIWVYLCKIYILQKQWVKKDQPGPRKWSKENTATYILSAPPARLSTQRANDRYKDHLNGQLTKPLPTRYRLFQNTYPSGPLRNTTRNSRGLIFGDFSLHIFFSSKRKEFMIRPGAVLKARTTLFSC